MKVINFFAGPGAGKSTTASGLFRLMKLDGKRVELVTEFSKELVYQEDYGTLSNQLFVFAEQDRRLRRLEGRGPDYVITDSPLPLNLIYAQPPWLSEWYADAVMGTFNTYDNINFLIRRVKPYQEYGRTQKEVEARALDGAVSNLLWSEKIPYTVIDGDEAASEGIFNFLKEYDGKARRAV